MANLSSLLLLPGWIKIGQARRTTPCDRRDLVRRLVNAKIGHPMKSNETKKESFGQKMAKKNGGIAAQKSSMPPVCGSHLQKQKTP
jgi:hypothetical protein